MYKQGLVWWCYGILCQMNGLGIIDFYDFFAVHGVHVGNQDINRRSGMEPKKWFVFQGKSWHQTHSVGAGFNYNSYCWWKKAGAHQLRLLVYPVIYRALCIPGGAGFLPSTVSCSPLLDEMIQVEDVFRLEVRQNHQLYRYPYGCIQK